MYTYIIYIAIRWVQLRILYRSHDADYVGSAGTCLTIGRALYTHMIASIIRIIKYLYTFLCLGGKSQRLLLSIVSFRIIINFFFFHKNTTRPMNVSSRTRNEYRSIRCRDCNATLIFFFSNLSVHCCHHKTTPFPSVDSIRETCTIINFSIRFLFF